MLNKTELVIRRKQKNGFERQNKRGNQKDRIDDGDLSNLVFSSFSAHATRRNKPAKTTPQKA